MLVFMKCHETFMKEKKPNIKYNNYSGLHASRDAAPGSHQVRPESLETFQPSYAYSSKVKSENDTI